MKRALCAVLISSILVGCAAMPDGTTLPTPDEMTTNLISKWETNAPDAISYMGIQDSLEAHAPQALPAELANQPIKTTFAEQAKLKELHAFLKPMGLSLVIPDAELRELDMVIFDFDGKLGDFLRAIGVAYGISFNWHPGNILTVEKNSQYMIKVPQDKEITAEIQTAITGLGAESISTSLSAGSISYRATYDVHQRILDYMKELSVNTAVVTLQAAVVTVSMDRSRDTGFDWGQLQAKVGALSIDSGDSFFNPGQVTTPTIDPATGEATSGSSSDSGTSSPGGLNVNDLASLALISQQGAGLILKKGDFDLRAVIRLLSTYGETETSQSVLMKTLSGKPVKLNSSQQIPYVSEIGSTTNNYNNGYNNSSNVDIEDLDVGLKLELAPYFDAHTGLVTVGVDVEISSLISFIEISAGNDVGNITRPHTQKQEFTDILRMMPGDSVIIGGLMYDQITDNRASLSPLDRFKLASQSKSTNRNALFIVLRPTVTVFKGGDK